MIHVLVDDRENKSGIAQHLQANDGVHVLITRLKLGDYQVDQRLLVERKTLQDFAVSLFDGRLLTQACRLASSRLRPLLIIEGQRDPETLGTSREAFQGALICLTVVLGIPVLRSAGPAETAQLILFAADQMKRKISGNVQRPGYRPKGKRKRQLFILQGLPGVGSKRAAELLDTLGSVEAVMEADAEELAEVPGIGMRMAERIRSVVT